MAADLNGQLHHPGDSLENLVDVGVEISQCKERVEPLFAVNELQTWLSAEVGMRNVPRHLYIIYTVQQSH